MMRKLTSGLCAAILVVGVAASALAIPPEAASPARLLAVKAVERPEAPSLLLEVSGPFSFTSYQPTERSVIVDLTGVVSDRSATEPAPGVEWLSGYRLLPFRNASGRNVLRLDISLKRDCGVEVSQLEPTALVVACASGEPQRAASVPATAPAASRAAEPVQVRRVVVHEQAGRVMVEIQASGPLHYETQVLRNPTRLVVDLPESVLLAQKRQFAVDQDAVVGVRVGQFKANPPITRLVVDLLKMVQFEISSEPEGLRLALPVSAAKGEEQPASLASVAPQDDPVPVEAAPVEQATELAREPEPILLASLAPTVPSTMASVPAPAAETTAVTPAARPAPAAPAPAVPATPAMQGQAPRQYTGEPVSVNLKDVDLKDFFRLIHEISGLNIVVDPNVRGAVTMVLIDVPWDQALDIVLKNNGLGSTLEGNVLRIATLDTLKKEQEDQRELAKARAEAVDPVTVTRQLSYAKAADLENTLKRFLSSRGEIIRDDRSNTLIIRDIPNVIPDVDNLIQQLDRKSLQVEIEARVVSASRAFSREIGSQFATAFTTTGGRSVFGGGLLTESPLSGGFPLPPLIAAGSEDAMPLASDFRGQVDGGTGSGFLFGHRSPNFALDAILTAAENRNIAKVLSKPRLVTQNNITAEVKQGTRIPVQTVVNNTISTQFIDVVLRLEVTPQITADGTVFLSVVIENTTIDVGIARINGIPALATQATTTQVLIDDGGTVVVGGVMVTNNSTIIDQVPLIGSIPVIGHLFKRTSVQTSTQELLFFITPRILPG